MNKYQYEFCHNLVKKLKKIQAFSIFIEDPRSIPGYTDEIKKPSWLNQIDDQLKNKKIKSIDKFKKKINRIWKNCIQFNANDSLFIATSYLFKDICDRKLKKIAPNETHAWCQKTKKCIKRIEHCVDLQLPSH